MTDRLSSLLASWKFSNFQIDVDRQYQVNILWLDGKTIVQRVPWDFSQAQIDFKAIERLGSKFQADFYPTVHNYSDGTFAVTFHVRGQGGGGSCCKEDSSSDARRPLLPVKLPPAQSSAAASRVVPAAAPNIDLAQVESRLSRIRDETVKHLSEHLDAYVPVVERREDRVVDLGEESDRFLQSEQKVFLVMGDAGTGKSIFLDSLCSKLWQRYRANGPITIWVSLPDLKNPLQRVIEDVLERQGFSPDEIAYLKQHRQFVVLLDGYDEIATDRNLFVTNRLDQWQVKVVITCRSQYLPDNYQDSFVPHVGERPRPGLLREKSISPFDPTQVDQYIRLQIEHNKTPWENWQACRKCIDSVPSLAFLVQNPFVLRMVVQMLPEVLERYAKLEKDECSRLTRRELYRLFVTGWFERQQKKLVQAGRIAADWDMRPKFFEFSQRLAQAMQKKGVYSVHYDEEHALFEQETVEWQPFFGQEDGQLELIRSGCPLRKTGNRWSFIHGTVLEFFFSEALFESMSHLPSEMEEERRAVILRVLPKLNERLLIDQHLIIQFAVDRAATETVFRQVLLDIVYLSAKDPSVAIAAANAITILCRAMPLSRLVFEGIRIPGADLSGAILDGTRLIDCDLRGVRLVKAFMKETVFTGSRMEGVALGQKSFITATEYIRHFTLSSKWIALIAGHGTTVHILDRSTHEPVRKLKCKWPKPIEKLEFSPQGDFLVVSCSCDGESGSSFIRTFSTAVFSTDTWEPLYLGNPDGWSAAYPANDFVFVGPFHILSRTYKKGEVTTYEKDSEIWDIRAQNSSSGFNIGKGVIPTASLSGQYIAYSKEKIIFVERVSDKKIVAQTQNVNTRYSPKCALSPDGTKLVYISGLDLVLYDVLRNRILKTFPSFPGIDRNSVIAFSPSGEAIAVSLDEQITVWSLEQEKEIARIPGHSSGIIHLQFSEDGRFIYSCSDDRTLRVREISGFQQSPGSERIWVRGVSASSQIIGGIDSENYRTIRFWRMGTGEVETSFMPFMPNEGYIKFLCVSRSGRTFITKGAMQGSHVLAVWDMATKTMIKKIPSELGKYTNALAISSDDRLVATTTVMGKESPVQVWDIETDTLKHDIRLPPKTGQNELKMGAYGLEFSPDATFLAISAATMCSREFTIVQLYDLKVGVVVKTFDEISGPILFSPDGKYFIYKGKHHRILFYNIESGQNEFTLEAHQHEITAIAISADGKMMASADSQGKVFLYDLTRRQVIKGFTAHLQWIVGLWFDENGRKLVSQGLDKIARMWELYDAKMGLDPRLCWTSNQSFYAREIGLGRTVGLSPENEAVFQQVDTTANAGVSLELPIR